MNENIRILLYGSNIWYLGEGLLGPLMAVFTERIGGDLLDITWAWATYLMVSGVMLVLVGKLVDGKEVKARVMVAGYALNAVLTFCYLLVETPAQLFALQAGLGLAAALATPTWNALYAKHEDKDHDAFEWGLADGQSQFITGAAILVGGVFVTKFSFDALFVLMGCIQVVATLYQAQILRHNR